MDGSGLERAFLIRERELLEGVYPAAEPVILIDAELAHRYSNVRLLELVDTPREPYPSHRNVDLRPIVAIDAREVVFFPSARPAAIMLDSRTPDGESASARRQRDRIWQSA